MKPMLSERKRMESRNPLLGTLTRSKSQIYSHLNRSGRHRTDAFAFKPSRRHPPAQIDVSHPTRRRQKSSLPTAGDDSSEVTMPPICIKDLRSRRVFSEPLVVSEQEEKNSMLSGTSGEVKPNSKTTEIDSLEKTFLSNRDCIDTFGLELTLLGPDGDGEKAVEGVDCIGGGLCGEDPNLSRSMGVCSEEKEGEIKGFGQGEDRLGFQKLDSPCNGHGLDDFGPVISNPNRIIDEENVHTTPPDSDILSLQKDVLLAQHNSTRMYSNGSPNTKTDSIPRSKLVLNPCRLKVFKTPSSVSYRRLLPYLLDIAKENSSTVKSQMCPSPKSDIVLEANPTVGSQVPQNPVFSSDLQSGKSTDQIQPKPTLMDFTCTTRATGVTTDRQNERLSPSNSPQRDSSQADQVSSAKRLKVFKSPSSVSYRRLLPFLKTVAKNKSCELEIKSCPKLESIFEEKPIVQSPAPLVHASCIHMSGFEDGTSKSLLHTASQEMLIEDSSNQKLPCSMQTKATDSQNEMLIPSITTSPSPDLVSDRTVCVSDSTSKMSVSCNDMDQKTTMSALADVITLYQSTSPSRDLPCLEPCTISSAKGILKRNPGGCRGLCTCLSCSSFRLHAERAFEFSRNQLQDTEEIVMGLMKELSQVRAALEMSDDDCSNSQGSSKINKFEEICASTFKAEEIARTRLKEMNKELFFHCRMKSLQRPRVNFAIELEEKRL